MFLAALLTMSQLSLPLFPAWGQDTKAKLTECLTLAGEDPVKAAATASEWRKAGGGYLARQCEGVAYANQQRWDAAAGAFEDAAREAETARDTHSADFWAQAGNAWLAFGDPARSRADLDTAIGSGTLIGLALGEAYLDRARAAVAQGSLETARSDLDLATVHAADDPLAWLLSATLARRMNDMPRARKDIAEALRRSPDDASVQLEAGNIAAKSADEPGARAAWARAIELAPGSKQAEAARNALEQFGAEH